MGALVAQLKPFGTGQAALVSANGLWLASPEAARVGQPVSDNITRSLVAEAAGGKVVQRVIHTDDGTASCGVCVSALRLIGSLMGSYDSATAYAFASEVRISGVDERWTLILTVPKADALQTVTDARNMMGGIAAIVMVLVLVLVWVGARLLTQPISDITDKMRALAGDDTSIQLDGLDRKDEIGAMARAVDVFRANAIERHALETARQETQAAQQARQAPSTG